MKPNYALLAALPLVLLCGCHVSTHNHSGNDNVDIGTPFGSMHVKTNDDVSTEGIGLTAYPGATLKKKDGKDDSAADVSLNFGKFHLGVKAVTYLTTDAQDKVLAFYRNDMKKYGDVIECNGRKSIGQPTRTGEGLTCDSKAHVTSNDDWNANDGLELRAGSKTHQHVVAVKQKNDQTEVGLVVLDLPTDVADDSDKDSSSKNKDSE